MAERAPALYKVALLGSPLAVMRAERWLREQGLAVTAIPMPRSISSDCGVCLRFLSTDEERVRALLEQRGMDIAEVHTL